MHGRVRARTPPNYLPRISAEKDSGRRVYPSENIKIGYKLEHIGLVIS